MNVTRQLRDGAGAGPTTRWMPGTRARLLLDHAFATNHALQLDELPHGDRPRGGQTAI
eukprot:CAMPEP_0170154278 /NCGR_PEP_ID=MMETSP0033_2-20121228/57482_1 /TAXON_ID=195969 /ORGANISM="Dolichomastix tenuilepis, Strain CCMP3274" /LENGTH=57 /DNA_ID=CAMNT_0010391519 /DNA_START=101 /DNA_END=271 /DNA_ORIENTATION=+